LIWRSVCSCRHPATFALTSIWCLIETFCSDWLNFSRFSLNAVNYLPASERAMVCVVCW
jgi:hypothetical protein